MNMKWVKMQALLLCVVLLLTGLPMASFAADSAIADAVCCSIHEKHKDGQSAEACDDLRPYSGSDGYYAVISTDDGPVWHRFDTDADDSLLTVLRAMLLRQTQITVYVALDRDLFDPMQYALHDYFAEKLFDNAFGAQVDPACTGDYLLSQVQQFTRDDITVNWVDVADYADKTQSIAFYEVVCNFSYCSTLQQEQILKAAAEKWSAEFITASPAILDAQNQNEREYLIVKTIYDFLVQNTEYDTQAYDSFMTGGDTNWYAHSAYAAFFGKAGQGAADLEETGYCWDKKLKNSLYQIDKGKQGLAVCEGYAALFYYLCRLNGVDCNTVLGEKQTYIAATGEYRTDIHAWNCVYLDDGCSDGYAWYQVDVTYAASNSIPLADYTNYYYFLCGSENAYFTAAEDHQTMYGAKQGYAYPALSPDDYSFANHNLGLDHYDGEGYIAIIRQSASGQTAIRDYVLVKKDSEGNDAYYKFILDENAQVATDEDGNARVEKLPDGTGLEYSGEKGGFFMLIPGYVYAREYTTVCESDADKYAPGRHTITATDGTNEVRCSFYINKIDVQAQDNRIVLNNLDANQRIQYGGCPIQVDIQVIDGYGKTAQQSQDYTVTFYDEAHRAVAEPMEPGVYTIDLDFSVSDRYTGRLTGTKENKLHFEIAKRSVANIGVADLNIAYSGKDIQPYMSEITMTAKTPEQEYRQTFTAGKDYTVSYTGSTVNAGSGTYTVTALPGSEYLTGTVTKKYTITPAAITRFDGWTAAAPVTYTGKQIKPAPSLFSDNSHLVSGKDYIVKSYGSNVKAGTGTVQIIGKGNYTGTATLKFTIAKKSITEKDVTFKYKNVTNTNADITLVYNGKTLKEGTDYKKSIAVKGNTRTLTVTGIGNFTSAYKIQSHVHTYKQTSSKAATYFATGYKKYRCTGCGGTKTTKLAQKKPTLSSVKSKKSKQLTVSWKKCTGISGYQIAYSTSSKFTKSTTKTVRVAKASSTTKTLAKLKSKKKYYVRVRVYKKSGGKYTYGAWSAVRSATTKK